MTTQTKFLMQSTTVDVAKFNEATTLDALPPGVYTLRWSKFRGFYLDIENETLAIPEKIYGKTPRRVQKCLQTYQERDGSTGILLTGDKGTGKSLLTACLANAVIKQLKMPVILIKESFAGTDFSGFIEKLGECCLLFDEFGKMYASSEEQARKQEKISQSELLSLMDGVNKTKRLLLFTENREWDINDFLLNRPSRVYYHFKYAKLEEDAITDYCEDFKVSKEITNQILSIVRRSRMFSFDMLQTIVEEHLRFGEDVATLLEELNVNDAPKAEQRATVLRITKNETGEELEVAKRITKFMDDGDFYCEFFKDNEMYLKVKESLESNEPNPEMQATIVENGWDQPKKKASFRMDDSYLVFEKGDLRVYDDGSYTVELELLPEEAPSYGAMVYRHAV